MQKRKILVASIINFIATFLPYGFIQAEKIHFLWKQVFIWDEYRKLKEIIMDELNRLNAISIYLISVLLMVCIFMYCRNEKNDLEKKIKYLAIASVGVNLFFCYHIYSVDAYKYINIGVLLAIVSSSYIIAVISGVNRKIILVLGAAAVLTFPTIIQVYSIDIEGMPEMFCFSIQNYFYVFYEAFLFVDMSWIYSIPSMVLVIITIKSVVCALCNSKSKIKVIKSQRVWMILAFGIEMLVMFTANEFTYITLTYPIAIILISIYLYLEKKEKQ